MTDNAVKTMEEAAVIMERIVGCGGASNSRFPAKSYEQGIRNALVWVYGPNHRFFEPLRSPGGFPWGDDE